MLEPVQTHVKNKERQEFKEQTDRKLHGPRMSLLMKFMAHELKYFNIHEKFMATNTMKFHFAVLNCVYMGHEMSFME